MKDIPSPPHYVLTGGPCAGKTTTIDELARRGFPVLAEAARLIIDEHLAAGKTIQEIVTAPDWLQSVVEKKLAMEQAVPLDEAFFFDRGVPDSLAYYKTSGTPIDEVLKSALSKVLYRRVFLLELIDFRNDEARSETPEQAAMLHRCIREAYEGQGYTIVDVPLMPVEERADFILANL